MAGRPGPGRSGGGWNKLSAEEHIRRGTYVPSRHGGRTARVVLMQGTEPVPPELIEGLTGKGKTFVEDCWKKYGDWTPPSLLVLEMIGTLKDDLDQLRHKPGERATQRLILTALDRLGLKD